MFRGIWQPRCLTSLLVDDLGSCYKKKYGQAIFERKKLREWHCEKGEEEKNNEGTLCSLSINIVLQSFQSDS